ncbi:hypothetical protein [Jannaschia sp. R86511]|uniref:hypothetical protein n=1 Tax=Jannaschia sp. R86511 TaxID=3093853 RepID=UPI0036D2F413
MDRYVVTVVVVALVVVALVVVGLLALRSHRRARAERTEHLQDRFGPEYDRAVADADDARQAEARLARTEKRRAELDVRPLTAASRVRRTQQWAEVQTRFVDEPVEAVDAADRLVADVMAERGYPTGGVEDKLSLLAADHAETVEHYRTAEGYRERFRSGGGSTEDLRRAFVEYRRLFEVLVNEGVESGGSITGESKTGDRETGDRETGDRETGDRETGDRETGDRETGDPRDR